LTDATTEDAPARAPSKVSSPVKPLDLLRPEPKPEATAPARGGVALFGLVLAGFALLAIYESAPVDRPEYPDCPVQSIGSCGLN